MHLHRLSSASRLAGVMPMQLVRSQTMPVDEDDELQRPDTRERLVRFGWLVPDKGPGLTIIGPQHWPACLRAPARAHCVAKKRQQRQTKLARQH